MNLNEPMPQTIKFFVESIEFFTIKSKLPILASKVFTEAKKITSNGAQPDDPDGTFVRVSQVSD